MTMAAARLEFAPIQGRTRLMGQYMPYPFHITQPFYLDDGLPDLATLYLQSSSGGVYRGDRLSLTLMASADARVMVTTQASTLVRHCGEERAETETHLCLESGSRLLYQPDPMILMPGADIVNSLRLTVPKDAVALCCDAYGFHDPAGGGARFARLETRTMVHRPDGSLLVSDRGVIRGEEIGTRASPLGPFRAFGTILLIHGDWTDRARTIAAVEVTGCVAGASALRNAAGVALRLLAIETGMLARGLAAACAAGFEVMFDRPPQPRRK